jgi:integrase
MGLRNMRGKWQYRFVSHGQSICVTLELAATERNAKKALAKEAAHRQAIEEGRWGWRPLTPRSFNDAQYDFEAWCKVEYQGKENTWRRIITSMASCVVFFGKTMISMIQPGNVEAYKVWRLTPRPDVPAVREVTAKHDLDNLSLFFQWSVKSGYARQNPVKEVKRPSDSKAIRERILTHAEEKLYFTHARGNLSKVARLILLQGMRPEEVMRIRKEDVDLEKGMLRVMFGKTPAARRTLKLTQEARSLLAVQMNLPKLAASPWVFPSPKKPGACIKKLNCSHDRVCEKIKLHFVMYDLRHTFATRMVEAGVDLVSLKDILGHEKISVTIRYVHLTQDRQNQAMAIYDKLNEERRKEVVQ